VYMYMYECVYNVHTCIRAYVHTQMLEYTPHTHTYTHTYIHTHTHTEMHSYTYTHTHTHTHTTPMAVVEWR